MTIREWKYEDILKISEIEKECFPDEPWNFRMLASGFESEGFVGVLAEDGGEVIGYGAITVAADSADVENVAVTEAYRGGGIATSIIKRLCEEAKKRGAEKLYLEVRVSNAAAMSLYLKQGFKGAYARLRYYKHGEDCLVMVKEL